eukprot:scpid95188/ scgid14469/ 
MEEQISSFIAAELEVTSSCSPKSKRKGKSATSTKASKRTANVRKKPPAIPTIPSSRTRGPSTTKAKKKKSAGRGAGHGVKTKQSQPKAAAAKAKKTVASQSTTHAAVQNESEHRASVSSTPSNQEDERQGSLMCLAAAAEAVHDSPEILEKRARKHSATSSSMPVSQGVQAGMEALNSHPTALHKSSIQQLPTGMLGPATHPSGNTATFTVARHPHASSAAHSYGHSDSPTLALLPGGNEQGPAQVMTWSRQTIGGNTAYLPQFSQLVTQQAGVQGALPPFYLPPLAHHYQQQHQH